jgi:hypothetical protein
MLTNLVVRLSERGCAILLLATSPKSKPADWPWGSWRSARGPGARLFGRCLTYRDL